MRRSTGLLFAIAGVSILAPWLAPFDPVAPLEIVKLRNQPPSFAHLLGTDAYSRDLLSRLLHGGRTSLIVAGVSTMVALTLGVLWAMVATLCGPRFGATMMSAADVLRSIPRILLFLGALVIAGRLDALGLAVALGLSSWPGASRLVYTVVQECLTRPFTEAARALGISPARVMLRHVGPHLVGPLGALGALLLADMLALEAGLSFLGLGVRAPVPSWGNMLQDALPYVRSAWWVAAVPCVLLITTVLAVARLADALADLHAAPRVAVDANQSVPMAWHTRLITTGTPRSTNPDA